MPKKRTGFKTEATFPDRHSLAFFRSTLRNWGRRNFASFPWRRTQNQFHALIAEVMLQRTRAEQVVPVYAEFVRRFPSPRDAAHANATSFLRLLRPLGLIWRARFLHRMVKVIAQNNGVVPHAIEKLKLLPGIGDYAASAYCTFHAKSSAPLIDSNIVRLYGRFFGVKTGPETRRTRRFRLLAEYVQPPSGAKAFGYALLDFTRSICTPRPHCDICPLAGACKYPKVNGHLAIQP